jgi:hypothetical protein
MNGPRKFAVSLIAACWAGHAVAQDVVAPPLEVEAASFVPAALMKGEAYEVQPQAVNDGYLNRYRLETPWGEVDAYGNYRLRARIQEIQALQTLDAMSRAGVFGESLKNGVLAPVEVVVDLVTDPINTVSGAVEGVGRWFGNIASSLGSSDPHQEGALSAAVGWAGTKRAYAVELGVDPYTDWEPLQEALASVGRAAFAGGITAKAAMGVATEGTVVATPVTALNLTDASRKRLIDDPPERLAATNRADLAKLGLSDELIDPFLDNYNYSPMEKLLLVEALKRMEGADGLEIYLAHATAAPDKRVARYMQERAEMMARFHRQISPASIIRTVETPLQRTRDGRVVGVFPFDYVPWTADLATILGAITADVDGLEGVSGKQLWFEGVVSPDTREAMEAYGWTVKEQVKLLLGDA